jgi:hypothetical protein
MSGSNPPGSRLCPNTETVKTTVVRNRIPTKHRIITSGRTTDQPEALGPALQQF